MSDSKLTLDETPRSTWSHSEADLYLAHQPYLFSKNTRAYFSLHLLSHSLGYAEDALICQSLMSPVIMPRGPVVWHTEMQNKNTREEPNKYNRFRKKELDLTLTLCILGSFACLFCMGESSKFKKSWTFETPILKLNIHNFKFKWSIVLRQTEN